MHESCKRFEGFPCCHRQWRHPGQCSHVHGYSRSFCFWFRATRLDVCGFVVDFSSLKALRSRLERQFDHTFLVNSDDPLMAEWRRLDAMGALALRVMDNVSMEATAGLIWSWANELLLEREGGRTCCWRAEARENASNAAFFSQLPSWYGTSSP